MPIFQINQLPTIPQAPADADVLAIEVNGITYKVSKQALAAAIAAGITPANIGALPLSGGAMAGNIDMGQSTPTSGARSVVWTTADGTIFRLRPYNNLMQLTREAPGNSQSNVIGVNSDGTYYVGNVSSFRTAIGATSGVWPVAIGGTGATNEAAARMNLNVYSKGEVDSYIGAKLYSVRGNIVKSASVGTAVGYGKAIVYIVGKTVIVEFEAKITTAGTVSDVYDVGIEVDNLQSINSSVPNFNVVNGGIIHYYNSDGTIDTSMENYAGETTINTAENRWAFARLYNTSGSVGAWSDNKFTVGKIITGTVYGTL